jgi:hypothetical protein
MAKLIAVRAATLDDVQRFQLSEQDDKECWSVLRVSGREGLQRSVARSADCYIAEEQGQAVCLFGCIPTGPGASFWLLFPAGIEKLPMSFFRTAQPVIDELLEKYEYLVNYAHVDKLFIIRLSKWLGFTVNDPQPYGHDGELFHCVWKRRE